MYKIYIQCKNYSVKITSWVVSFSTLAHLLHFMLSWWWKVLYHAISTFRFVYINFPALVYSILMHVLNIFFEVTQFHHMHQTARYSCSSECVTVYTSHAQWKTVAYLVLALQDPSHPLSTAVCIDLVLCPDPTLPESFEKGLVTIRHPARPSVV